MHNMARTVFLLRQRMYCVLDVHQTVDSGRLTSKNLMKLATESSSRGVKRLRDDSDPIAQLLEEQSIAKDDEEVAVDVKAACSGLCAILKRQPVIPYRSDSPETVKRQPALFGSDSSSRIEFRRVLLR
ncbi:hypothetical protein C8J56DRAFT_1046721 [Mycena floridula]|nr:hypothetical protein C8J56DRAFT_1046721 [Mycena floridula]